MYIYIYIIIIIYNNNNNAVLTKEITCIIVRDLHRSYIIKYKTNNIYIIMCLSINFLLHRLLLYNQKKSIFFYTYLIFTFIILKFYMISKIFFLNFEVTEKREFNELMAFIYVGMQ